ncbi:enoyl-CoA hydratase [Verticiella sediminum]|uniref:Enoyl-CoA hydratase n=1 Tax=Verticiella sediminum TaxID=1247510 RepID=A0A556AY79_9BURK|nr:enoyl-CoA hydratase [Verticiella sediminum]TSH97889.1 enoyl-CoA hydratase [Verticiella sediminum]
MTNTLVDRPHALATLDARGIATLTLRNAGVLNILSTPVIRDNTEALRTLAAREDVRAVVLQGESPRAFVAGADIAEMASLDGASARAFISGLRDLCNAVRHFPAPVIACVPGWCLGGGMELAMACDLRVASENAHFGMPEVKVGIPSVIHAALLPYLIGGANTAWLLMMGETIDAARALSWGLVNEVVPAGELDGAIDRMAGALAAMGPAAIRQQKKLLRAWEPAHIDDAIEATVAEFGAAFRTGEPQHFMNAFLERKAREQRG